MPGGGGFVGSVYHPPPKRRPRVFWSVEEEAALAEGMRRFGRKWSAILTAYESVFSANARTQSDLKDKARVLEGASARLNA